MPANLVNNKFKAKFIIIVIIFLTFPGILTMPIVSKSNKNVKINSKNNINTISENIWTPEHSLIKFMKISADINNDNGNISVDNIKFTNKGISLVYFETVNSYYNNYDDKVVITLTGYRKTLITKSSLQKYEFIIDL